MFSQNKEEQIILEYFGDFVGTFADLGCNDGQTFSNTRALALRGWKGVLIDPHPEAIQRCRELYKGYKGLYFYEYAISEHNGKKPINASGPLCTASDIGLVSTFHSHEMDRFKSKVDYNPIEVLTYKWKTALNRWTIRRFDMISIDVEGGEILKTKTGEKYSILNDIDLTETKLVCIETNGNQEFKILHERHLEGFKLIYTSGENLIYAR